MFTGSGDQLGVSSEDDDLSANLLLPDESFNQGIDCHKDLHFINTCFLQYVFDIQCCLLIC